MLAFFEFLCRLFGLVDLIETGTLCLVIEFVNVQRNENITLFFHLSKENSRFVLIFLL